MQPRTLTCGPGCSLIVLAVLLALNAPVVLSDASSQPQGESDNCLMQKQTHMTKVGVSTLKAQGSSDSFTQKTTPEYEAFPGHACEQPEEVAFVLPKKMEGPGVDVEACMTECNNRGDSCVAFNIADNKCWLKSGMKPDKRTDQWRACYVKVLTTTSAEAEAEAEAEHWRQVYEDGNECTDASVCSAPCPCTTEQQNQDCCVCGGGVQRKAEMQCEADAAANNKTAANTAATDICTDVVGPICSVTDSVCSRTAIGTTASVCDWMIDGSASTGGGNPTWRQERDCCAFGGGSTRTWKTEAEQDEADEALSAERQRDAMADGTAIASGEA